MSVSLMTLPVAVDVWIQERKNTQKQRQKPVMRSNLTDAKTRTLSWLEDVKDVEVRFTQ